MDFSALKLKLLATEMTVLSDDDARLDSLIDDTIPQYGWLSIEAVKSYIRRNSLWKAFKDAANDPAATDNIVTAWDTVNDSNTLGFDLSDPATLGFVTVLLGFLVTEITLFTKPHKASILALGKIQTSWAKENGFTQLRQGDLNYARSL